MDSHQVRCRGRALYKLYQSVSRMVHCILLLLNRHILFMSLRVVRSKARNGDLSARRALSSGGKGRGLVGMGLGG